MLVMEDRSIKAAAKNGNNSGELVTNVTNSNNVLCDTELTMLRNTRVKLMPCCKQFNEDKRNSDETWIGLKDIDFENEMRSFKLN